MTKRAQKVGLILGTLFVAGILVGFILIKLNLYLPCPFRALTGLLCPGCGATRMSMALMQLDFKAAFHYNGLLLISIPLFVFIAGSMCYTYIRYGNLKLGKKTDILVIIMIVAFLIFAVVRNII